MSYTPTEWHGGDVLSAEAMNKIENGIANAGSGALEVRIETSQDGNTTTLDKTWQEIYDAFPNVYIYIEDDAFTGKNLILSVGYENETYSINIDGSTFVTDSSDGYPYREQQDTPVIK